MKNLLKGTAVAVIVLIVNLILNMICNKQGINLDSAVTGTVSAVSAMLIYHGLVNKEKSKK